MGEEMTADYARRVGERLRNVRKQQRLSLQAVEAASNAEFKASVLGAYERGERAISVPRLQRLARFYNVPVDQLLPRFNGPNPMWQPPDTDEDAQAAPTLDKLTIDLTRLDSAPSPAADLLGRYLGMIQVKRQDFNGRVLTIRQDDRGAIACMLGTDPDHLSHHLEEMGLRS